jgi:hypothetical protein
VAPVRGGGVCSGSPCSQTHAGTVAAPDADMPTQSDRPSAALDASIMSMSNLGSECRSSLVPYSTDASHVSK